jgi:hypothetical protein
MVTFVCSFLSPHRPVPLTVVADHIDYIARGRCPDWFPTCNVHGFPGIGTQHIGFGSDFDGDDEIIVGLEVWRLCGVIVYLLLSFFFV